MNIRIWEVWIHPMNDDFVLHTPKGSTHPIESVHVHDFIRQAASRGMARLIIERKGLES